MPLSLVTPTRRRWHWLRRQARAIAGQLAPDDRWIIAVDNDRPDNKVLGDIARLVPAEQITWLHAAYTRPAPPVACVNRLRNAATALAPAGHDIVEVDDHDLLAPYALAEIRAALSAGYDYVFGWQHQQAVISVGNGLRAVPLVDGLRAVPLVDGLRAVPGPTDGLSIGHSRNGTESVPYRRIGTQIEVWPDVQHRYLRGAFARREIDAIGIRAFKRWLWTTLGGWATHVWPGGDYHFARRAESIGANIICIEQPLCTVTIEPESLSATNR